MPYKDKEQQKLAQAQHYQQNKEAYRARASRQKEERRLKLIEFKSRPCADCEKSYPYYVMQFDHLRDKSFSIGASWQQKGWQKVLDEIAKCEVVCANCHAERTWQRLTAVPQSLQFPSIG